MSKDKRKWEEALLRRRFREGVMSLEAAWAAAKRLRDSARAGTEAKTRHRRIADKLEEAIKTADAVLPDLPPGA